MNSPKDNSSEWHDNDVTPPASSRYIPIAWEDSVEVRSDGFIMVRKQYLELIEEQHRVELDQIRSQHRQELEQIARGVDEELHPRADYLQNLAGTLFGIAAGAACSIPQLMTTSPLSNWVVPTYTVSAIALFLITLILFFIDRSLRAARRKSVRSISQGIRKLLETEPPTEAGPPAVAPASGVVSPSQTAG